MKSNVITFNFGWSPINYGAILTNFALQEILKENNYSPTFITDNDYVLDITAKNYNLFEKFANNITFLNIGNNNMSLFDLNKLSDTFITGSDQVFRIKGLKNKSHRYLLDFADINKKKIAFSASFGVDKEQFFKDNTKETIDKLKNALNSFDFISVREISGVDICNDILGVNAEWIIDPVFILEKSNYDKLISKSNNNYMNKIVSYVLDTNKEYKQAYKYLASIYDAQVIELSKSQAPVEEWLTAIKDCKLLVTDSFHGMCFAMIFNKPFICISNKKRGQARFDSIISMFDLKNQCIDSINEIYNRDCIFNIDYDKLNNKIEQERQKGIDFLLKALDAPVQITQDKITSRMSYLENQIIKLENENNFKIQFQQVFHKMLLKIYYSLPEFIQIIIAIIRKWRK